MMFLNGFLFTLGSIAATFCFFFALILFLKSRKKAPKATAKDWRKYLLDITKANEFEEASIVANLVLNKADHEEIDTPDGYKIKVDKDIIIDDNDGDGISKIKVNKTFKIIKL